MSQRMSVDEFLGLNKKHSKPRAKPDQPEHDEQVQFFGWAARQRIPGLGLMHAVPNGGQRHPAVAAKLKAEGVKAGVLDILWPVPRGGFCGLAIEFKAEDGNLTKDQRERIKALQLEGWLCVVVWEWQAAARTVLGYAGLAKVELCAVCDD